VGGFGCGSSVKQKAGRIDDEVESPMVITTSKPTGDTEVVPGDYVKPKTGLFSQAGKRVKALFQQAHSK